MVAETVLSHSERSWPGHCSGWLLVALRCGSYILLSSLAHKDLMALDWEA